MNPANGRFLIYMFMFQDLMTIVFRDMLLDLTTCCEDIDAAGQFGSHLNIGTDKEW